MNTETMPSNASAVNYGVLSISDELPTTSETMFSSGSTTVSISTKTQVGFRAVIITMGIVGSLANGIVALVLKLATGTKNERVNLLMTNQLMLDMFSCFSLIAVYATKLVNLYLTSSWGYWLCVLFVGEMPLWIGLNGSVSNLVIISVERYVMIVHSIWHKNHVRTWMIYTAMAFSWIYGTVTNVLVYIPTSNIVEGQCIWIAFWSSQASAVIYSTWYILFSYVIPIIAFCFCYGRILITIVRQSRTLKLTTVATGHGGASEASAQMNAHRTKVNIVKTMTTLTVMFAVCWMPISIYYFAFVLNPSLFNNTIYQCALFFAFLSICLNPFVYAGQYEVVRHRMKNIFVSVSESVRRLVGIPTHVSTVHPSS